MKNSETVAIFDQHNTKIGSYLVYYIMLLVIYYTVIVIRWVDLYFS